jgi:hypothetical protein
VLAVLHEEIERADDGRREHGDQDAVPRVLHVEELELAGDRLGELAGHRPVLPERVVLDHQRHAERGQDRGQRVAAHQRPQGGDLEDGAEQGHAEHGPAQGEPEVAGEEEHRGAHVGAEHEQVAVGEVHDVHDPEDQRQPRGDERQDHAVDEPVDDLHEDLVVGHAAHTPRYWWMTA